MTVDCAQCMLGHHARAHTRSVHAVSAFGSCGNETYIFIYSRTSPMPGQARPGQQRMRIHTNNNLLLVDTVTDVIILRATLNGHLSHVPTIFFVQRLHRTRLALTQNDNVKLSAVAAGKPMAHPCVGMSAVCVRAFVSSSLLTDFLNCYFPMPATASRPQCHSVTHYINCGCGDVRKVLLGFLCDSPGESFEAIYKHGRSILLLIEWLAFVCYTYTYFDLDGILHVLSHFQISLFFNGACRQYNRRNCSKPFMQIYFL